jgi:hypothetical protein
VGERTEAKRLIAQSNRAGSCSIASSAVRAAECVGCGDPFVCPFPFDGPPMIEAAVGLPVGEGAGCGRAVGNGGLLDT